MRNVTAKPPERTDYTKLGVGSYFYVTLGPRSALSTRFVITWSACLGVFHMCFTLIASFCSLSEHCTTCFTIFGICLCTAGIGPDLDGNRAPKMKHISHADMLFHDMLCLLSRYVSRYVCFSILRNTSLCFTISEQQSRAPSAAPLRNDPLAYLID